MNMLINFDRSRLWSWVNVALLLALSGCMSTQGTGDSAGAAGTSAGMSGGAGVTGGNAGAGGAGGSGGAAVDDATAGNAGGAGNSAGSGGGGGGTAGGTGGAGPVDSGAPHTDDASVGREAAAGDAGAAAACAMLADAACAKLQSCSAFAVGALFGDVTRCRERIALTCLPTFDAPGTSATPARTLACAQSLPALACETLSIANLGPDCAAQPGTLAAGAACGDDAQCASAFCARASDAVCGVCAAATHAGDPCVRGTCSAGTVCPAGATTCIVPVAGQVGDPCTVQEQCDIAHAVGCDTLGRRCLRLTLATSTCGANSLLAPTSFALCPASGTCSALIGGTCSPAAADGATCNTMSGPACMPPARCVAGTCVVPAPSTCR